MDKNQLKTEKNQRMSVPNSEGQEEHVDTEQQVAVAQQMEEDKIAVQPEKKKREFRAHKKIEDYKDYKSIPYMKPEGSKRGLSENFISVQFGSQYDSRYIKADKNGNKDVIKEVEFKETSNSANFPTSVNSKECEITDVRLLMSYKEDRKDLNEEAKYVIVEINKEHFIVKKKVKDGNQKYDRYQANIQIKPLQDEVKEERPLYNVFIPITKEKNENGEVIERWKTNEMKKELMNKEPVTEEKLRDIKQIKKDILDIRKRIKSTESILKEKVFYVEGLSMNEELGQEEYEQKLRETNEEVKQLDSKIREMNKDILRKKRDLRKSEVDLPGCVILKKLEDQIVEIKEYNEETGKFDKYEERIRGIDADMLREQRDQEERMFDRLYERRRKNYEKIVAQHKQGMEEMKGINASIKGIEEYFRVSRIPEKDRSDKEKKFYEMCINKYKSDKDIREYYQTLLHKKKQIEDIGKSIIFVQRYGTLKEKIRNRKKLTPDEADWLRGNSVMIDPEIGEGKYDSDKYSVLCTFRVEDDGIVKINCNVKRQGQKVGITMDMSTKGCKIFISMNPDVNDQFKNLMKYGEIEQVMYSYYATGEQRKMIKERLKAEKIAKEELEKAKMEEEELAKENEQVKEENEEEPVEKEIHMEEEQQQIE